MQKMISFQINKTLAKKIAEIYHTPEVDFESANAFEQAIFAAIKQIIWGEEGGMYQLPHEFSELSTETRGKRPVEKAKAQIASRLKNYIFSVSCNAGHIEFAMKNISVSRKGKLSLKAKAAETDRSHLKVLFALFVGIVNQLSERQFVLPETHDISTKDGLRFGFEYGEAAPEVFEALNEMIENRACFASNLSARKYRDVIKAQSECLGVE